MEKTIRRNQEEEFWKTRSQRYNRLKWANDKKYIDQFIDACDLQKSDLVLDVGCGTGIITHAIAPYVSEVIGLDKSQDMLDHSNWQGNKYFIKRDIRDRMFHEGVFDKVTARMVFHHITERTQDAMHECYRVLKKGGRFIISEGVPPKYSLKEDYTKIFKLKEKRLVFLPEDLENMMKKEGLNDIKQTVNITRSFSVKDWLENSGLPDSTKQVIFGLHKYGSREFKKAYNLRLKGDDCIIETKNIILSGIK